MEWFQKIVDYIGSMSALDWASAYFSLTLGPLLGPAYFILRYYIFL